jgi:predicted flap endonuclease-1-like 5' DNA nuclease
MGGFGNKLLLSIVGICKATEQSLNCRGKLRYVQIVHLKGEGIWMQ